MFAANQVNIAKVRQKIVEFEPNLEGVTRGCDDFRINGSGCDEKLGCFIARLQ